MPQTLGEHSGISARFAVPITEFSAETRVDYAGRNALQRGSWRQKMAVFNIFVLLTPPLLAGGYLYLIASNAFEVETIISIRNPSNSVGGASSVMTSLTSGVASGGSTTMERAIDESYAVVNYIQSREAFDELNKRMGFSEHFKGSDIDWFGRLSSNATHEQQYQYYLKHVDVSYDDVEGEVDLTTYGYDAETTFKMASELSDMSERLVNRFNERSQADLIKLARQQVTEAAGEMRSTNDAITKFQIQNSMIDPSTETAAFGTIINNLRGQASSKRAELNALDKTSSPTAPRTVEIKNMLDATEQQIRQEQSKLTGQANALAPLISTYKLLSVDQQLAQQKYSSAVAMLQTSLIQAEHQKLYVMEVVSPREPVQPTLPSRGKGMLAVILGTLVTWVIARLGLAAIRDHRV